MHSSNLPKTYFVHCRLNVLHKFLHLTSVTPQQTDTITATLTKCKEQSWTAWPLTRHTNTHSRWNVLTFEKANLCEWLCSPKTNIQQIKANNNNNGKENSVSFQNFSRNIPLCYLAFAFLFIVEFNTQINISFSLYLCLFWLCFYDSIVSCSREYSQRKKGTNRKRDMRRCRGGQMRKWKKGEKWNWMDGEWEEGACRILANTLLWLRYRQDLLPGCA